MNTASPTRCPKSNPASSLLYSHSCCRSREERRVARLSLRPLYSCGSSNSSLKAMKTMTPIIAAKNMAGKEKVDSSILPTCSFRAPQHNAIVCANRKFCWQRLLYCKATARGKGAAPRGRRKQALSAFRPGAQRFSSWARPSRSSLRAFSPASFAANSDLNPSPSNLTPIGFDRL